MAQLRMIELVQRRAPIEVRAGLLPQPPLDLSHLRRFTMGNRALEIEVLGLFAEQAPLTLGAMQLASTEKAWRDAAHTLKGSALAVGATLIARTAAEAELLKSTPSAWPDILARLHVAIRDACFFISNTANTPISERAP